MALHIAGDMCVGVQREGRIGMSENVGERLGVYTACQRVGGEGMPKVVEADRGQSGRFQQLFHPVVCRAGDDWVFRPERVWKYPFAECCQFPLPQELCRAERERNSARSLAGLRAAGCVVPNFCAVERAGDLQGSLCLIKILPHKATDLTAAQAGGQLDIEEVMPDGILSALRHESLQLLVVQNALGLSVWFRHRCAIGWIDGYHPCADGILHRKVQHGVNVSDRLIRELSTKLRVFIHSAVLFQLPV